MKEQKLRETLKAGLFNRLIVRTTTGDWIPFGVSNNWISVNCIDVPSPSHKVCKPHLFSLDHLTKPMRIEGYNEGEEFIPAVEIHEFKESNIQLMYYVKGLSVGDDSCSIEIAPKKVLDFLRKLHFNTEGLAPEDYIDASKSKVYEPK